MTNAGASDTWVNCSVTIIAADGLHARPVIQIARVARDFSASIRIRLDGETRWVDAKSVAKLMTLRAENGRTVHLKASGEDAQSALDTLAVLIGSDLSEPSEADR